MILIYALSYNLPWTIHTDASNTCVHSKHNIKSGFIWSPGILQGFIWSPGILIPSSFLRSFLLLLKTFLLLDTGNKKGMLCMTDNINSDKWQITERDKIVHVE